MRTPQRLFLIFSGAILVMVTLFVVLNIHSARLALEQSLAERAAEYRSAYGIAESSMLISASQMASFIAADEQTTRFMVRAAGALANQDPDVAARAAADLRYAWLQAMQPRLRNLQREYGMSELSFYLSATDHARNFLRVHRPEHFGAQLHSPGHPVFQAMVQGAEIAVPVLDADGASLRAAAPVWGLAPNSDEPVVIGVVEAGVSFDALLNLLHERLDVQAVALLDRDLVAPIVDAPVVQRRMRLIPGSSCYRLAEAGPQAELLSAGVQACPAGSGVEGVPVDTLAGRRFARTQVSLGINGSNARRRGQALLWFDAEAAFASYERTLALTIASAVCGYIVLELVLFWLLRTGVRFFESELRRRTGEIRQLNRRLTRMATVDSLTGLFNRRHFLQRMQVEMDRVRRTGGELGLILIDLDHFKSVNDQYGHQVGDEVLRKTGQFLREEIRSIDTAGRYGGEELCILLPDTDSEQAMLIAERLREQMAGLRFSRGDGETFGITASFGVAAWDGLADRDTLFVQADNALYAAKAAGRNRVVLFDDIPPVSRR